MKLTKTQLDYLRSAAANPTGRTAIYGGSVFDRLTSAGLVEHEGFNIVKITPAGRQALATSKGGER